MNFETDNKIPLHEEASWEMANKWKKATGLPMNIWIDENKTYLRGGHSKRIKFQLDSSLRMNIHNSAPMGLDGEIKVKLPKHIELTSKEIEQLRNWVLNNQYVLDLVADVRLSLDEIFPYMIQGGEKASLNEILKLNAIADELKID